MTTRSEFEDASSRAPSAVFVGTTLGLISVLLVPNNYMNSESDFFFWLTLLPLVGAASGVAWEVGHRAEARSNPDEE